MDLHLAGRVALIGASSKGLGRAVAEELAAEGVHVTICGRDQHALDEAHAAIETKGPGQVLACQADLSNADDRKRLIIDVEMQLGPIDILVTNSGGPPPGPFESHLLDAWQATYKSVLESCVDLIGCVLPGMKERRWGRIISISSVAVKQPVPGLILSNSVRTSIVGLVRTLANEVAPFGVTVNNVLPGYTATERMTKLADTDPSFATVSADIPMERLGTPQEFAAAVAFLASDRASYITGVSMPVDGGWCRSLL